MAKFKMHKTFFIFEIHIFNLKYFLIKSLSFQDEKVVKKNCFFSDLLGNIEFFLHFFVLQIIHVCLLYLYIYFYVE